MGAPARVRRLGQGSWGSPPGLLNMLKIPITAAVAVVTPTTTTPVFAQRVNTSPPSNFEGSCFPSSRFASAFATRSMEEGGTLPSMRFAIAVATRSKLRSGFGG